MVDGGGTGQLGLKLTRFESSDLEVALPWFEDPETSRWLGDGDWLRLMVAMTDLPLIEFRGANETERFGWLAWNGDEPIGYLDCGTYDRWTTWDGERVISAIEVPSASLAYTVDPLRRRRGYGVSMLEALLEAPEMSEIELFGAGVDPTNAASIGYLTAAGFIQQYREPDFEGMLYFLKRR